MERHLSSWFVLALAGAVVLSADGASAFSPARQFPNTADGVYVYVDQLPSGMTASQRQFAATHYVGTQKQTSSLIDALRVYNPNFLMIQYRLGVRESGHEASYIHDNTWSSDWDTINPNEDWFVHDDQGNRVYQLYGSTLEEYCMDVSGLIEGNTTYGWKEYWADCVIADINASHGDGVFADSTHLPYAVPSDLWDSPIGSPPHTAYIPHMEIYYDYVYQQFDQANKYFIPNVGGLITTVDNTNGYYEDVHGAMVEGYGTKASEFDWRLQQNRVLRLLGNGKIYIAQNDVSGPTDIAERNWLFSNYMLLKHDKSFINMFPSGGGLSGQLHWWPEYDLDLGAQVDPGVPTDVSSLQDAGGMYYRQYEGGLVLVNATGSTRTFTLTGKGTYKLVEPWGGGLVNTVGIPPAGGLTLTDPGESVQLGPWSGAVLTFEPQPPPGVQYTFKYLGDGKYGVSFTVCGNDGEQASFFANMTFEGTAGGELQQVQALGSFDVDNETDADSWDGLGDPPYDKDADSWFGDPFAKSPPASIVALTEAANYYHIEAGTGGGSAYEDAKLAYIVTTGDVSFYGVISRLAENYDVSAIAEMPLPGDANEDGSVDGADYTIWADNYETGGVGWGGGDFNGDDVVDGADYTIWADFYTDGGSAVPEPGALGAMGLGAIALLRRRRR